jgi:hypothetical protein
MSQTRIFKLLVQVSECCVDILKYLDKNITTINQLGVKIQIQKINKDDLDEELVRKLNDKGITRLPALITDDQKVFIGIKKIRDLFESGLNSVRKSSIAGPAIDTGGGAEMGNNPDMQDFYMRELYEGYENGKFIPRKDDDKVDGDKNDIEDRIRRYQGSVPKHRQNDERNIDVEGGEMTRRQQRTHDYNTPNDNKYEDNIADDEIDMNQMRGGGNNGGNISSSFRPTDDALDDKMMMAWMDKNGDE